MKTKEVIDNLAGGMWLVRTGIFKHATFVIYIFFLVILYIGMNFGIERSQVTERTNVKVLKDLKADFTGKTARLLYQSKRLEIELKLTEYNSTLKNPHEPPRRVIIEK
ncbi:MAG: FtsL-like putative cell division protein [Bacteroidales bacterium]|nr:FtsL-like putative cell division protein [Bacteroidales bacterium]